MGNITINEVSKSYVYDITDSNYATVAMPITSMWGPGIAYDDVKDNLGKLDQFSDLWQTFNATREGIEAFARTFRGASSLYRVEKDYSYQMALTLLANGYNVSAIRITNGGAANLYGSINQTTYFSGALTKLSDGVYERQTKLPESDDIFKLFNTQNNGKVFEISGIFGDFVNQTTASTVSAKKVTLTLGQDSHTITITISEGEKEAESKLIPVTIKLEVSGGAAATWASLSTTTWGAISDKTWRNLGGGNPTPYTYAEVLAASGVTDSVISESNNTIMLTITNPKEGTVDAPIEGVYYTATATAKYAGTFGNRLKVEISNTVYSTRKDIWNATTYILRDDGGITPAESINFVLDYDKSTDTLYYIDEISDYSEYLGGISLGSLVNLAGFGESAYACELTAKEDGKGTDFNDTVSTDKISAYVDTALTDRGYDGSDIYYTEVNSAVAKMVTDRSFTEARYLLDIQQKFTAYYFLLDMLTDKLSFSPQFIISGGWDDMCLSLFDSSASKFAVVPRVAPLHAKLMEVAYKSRCSCALLDIPRDLPIDFVKTGDSKLPGYAEKLAEQGSVIDNLYATHSALFTPWGKYAYVGMNRPVECAPSIEYLLIERAMIRNQATQYYWCLPSTRSHNLSFGKLDYKVSKSYLDSWQKDFGTSVNVVTDIPSLGLSLWGNSTLYNTPVATYQALSNLSTRLLVNAVEDLVYRCGIAITYQYNNSAAYSSFVAGVTPLLDTMVNVGAIEDYYVRMASGVNGLDSVRANEVVGLIYLTIRGVINNITVDLVCLPDGTDLNQYRV